VSKLWKIAILNTLATTFYIVLIGLFFYFGTIVKFGQDKTFLVPVAMLLLFVLSAAITSFLVFGKPAQMYVDGLKKEALTLLTYTLMSFAVITLTFLFLLLLFSR
jgi:hypothetical protein